MSLHNPPPSLACAYIRFMRPVFLWLCLFLLTGCVHLPQPDVLQPLVIVPASWQLQGVDTALSCPATVPGTVHMDLHAAGLAPHPFADKAEEELAWIENRRWQYSASLHVPAQALRYDAALLTFHGLDTYADVFLNGTLIFTAHNMHRTWQQDVRPHLREGQNTLEIVFTPPTLHHNVRQVLPSYPAHFPTDNDTSRVAALTRKAAYHFGWDWAPRHISMGVWRPVELFCVNGAHASAPVIETVSIAPDSARVRLTARIASFGESHTHLKATFAHGNWQGTIAPHTDTLIEMTWTIARPELWWPATHGTPHLYRDTLRLCAGNTPVQLLPITYGVRTIKLVNEPDSMGTSYYFEVNGTPMFVQGANYVPQHVWLPAVKPAQYRHLLHLASQARMNMLRVWGGGVYEDDLFYHLCDSLGIMVWHDFMYAGTMYPWNADFLANALAEAEWQVRRLGTHSCMALWCGNNEVEVAWRNWGWQHTYGYPQALQDSMWGGYEKLFHHLLPGAVGRHCPSLSYVPTSPQSNWGGTEGFRHGSMHYWGVWHGREPASAFTTHVGRFMVEYGLQSYPHSATLAPWLPAHALNPESDAMQRRQKSYIGNGEIERHMRDFELTWSDPEGYIHASQQAQALALGLATDAHRRAQPVCMGTLLWQLNDCWPGPSWSIIDHSGAPKAAYYKVQEVYSRPFGK